MEEYLISLDDSEDYKSYVDMVATPTRRDQRTDSSEEDFTPPVAKKPTLEENEDSMETTVTRLVTLDGIPFRVFVNSEHFIYLLEASGYILPDSADAIKKVVLNEAKKAKIKVAQRLKELKNYGHKFSLTANEWISTRNRRYLNIKLHSPLLGGDQNHISLGLIRIAGSGIAMKYELLIEKRLKMFGICYKDIVGLTTDGSIAMVNMGESLPVYHQLCYAHALQLAVMDVLYKRDATFNEAFNEINFRFKVCVDDSDDDSDSESEDDGLRIILPAVKYQSLDNTNYKPLIEKVRKVVKMLKISPFNDVLRTHVKEDFGKEISLILDSKTKWSSLSSMLERFTMLYPSVQKTLIDIQSDIRFEDRELSVIKQIHDALEFVKSTVEILCQRDATLLTADTALKQIFNKLRTMPGCLNAKLLSALQKRISERYLLIQGVLSYLNSAKDFFEDCQQYIFYKPSPNIIKTMVVALVIKPSTCTSDEQAITAPLITFKMCEEELSDKTKSQQATIAHSENCSESTAATPTLDEEKRLPQIVLEEMFLYENGGERGKFLTKAYQQLLAIKPTSIEPERAFSAAGYYCNKLKSKLGDSTLDTLMFLRSYMMLKK